MPKPARTTHRLRFESLEARKVLSSVVLDHVAGANEYGPDDLAADAAQLWFYLPNSQGAGAGLRNGAGIWASDGTAQRTARIVSSDQPLNDITPFRGRTLLSSGSGLFSSDGTEAGTTRISSGPVGDMSTLGAQVLFAKGTAAPTKLETTGNELWASDGTATGTAQLLDLYPGGRWVTRGTPSGTIRTWIANSSSPAELTTINGVALFAATNATNGRELWKTDGTAAGTTLLNDISSGSASGNPVNLTRAGNRVFFTSGNDLWKTTGTAIGTVKLKTLSVAPTGLTASGDTLYFAVGDELWKSNGTSASTVRIQDIVPGAVGEGIEHLTAFGDGVVFTAADSSAGRELWTSNGTLAGTQRIADVRPGVTGSIPSGTAGDLEISGGRVYFTADNGVSGVELWASDGTAAGTKLIHDIFFGSSSSNPEELTDVDGVLYFTAFDPTFGRELRRTPADPRPGLKIDGPAEVIEGQSGARATTFIVTLSTPSIVPVTVQYTTKDGYPLPGAAPSLVAAAGSDYVATSGALTFAPGETVKSIAVPVIGDRVREQHEGFSLILFSPEGANLYRASASATIQDDEPYFSVAGGSVVEGRSGTTTWLEFTVTLSAAYDIPLTLSFTTNTSYGAPTATAGTDFAQTSGTVTFAPGETTKTIRVKVFGDKSRREGDEFVALQVSDPFDSLNPIYGFGFILNDD